METPPEKQIPKQLEPYIFKKGVSGNPNGRPKGPTLKEWVREQITMMNDDDRVEFLKRVPAEVIWKLAEGNPHSTEDVRHTVAPTPIMDIVKVDKIENSVAPLAIDAPSTENHG